MSKKFRIIPTVQFKNGSVVKSINYQNHRIVGDIASTIRVYSRRQADELVFYNLDTLDGSQINWATISSCVQNSNMPLTYGGGIRSVEVANTLIGSGFDKISFNTVLFEDPNIIYQTSKLIGSSSTVATVDLHFMEGRLCMFSNGGQRYQKEFKPMETIKLLEELGVGELVINCIDRDGLMNGYDFENIGTIPSIAKIPVLLSGGCSGVECIQEAYEHGFDGAMMSSIFLWQGDSIPSLKDALFEKVPIRRVVQ